MSRTARCRRSSEPTRISPFASTRLRRISKGQEIIIPPFVVGDFLEVVFIRKHNTIFEYMHYLKEGWFADGPTG